ncbi:hypothetical protein [Puniceicoccus vermicola]|uniref:Uncharacterized protein n=1 Tax=Puniceicoccus vermicola TaxID=388746 RepID=A0A7X1B2A6_9BACT|nr:hypothetical protein [Puniceicoccus vermicola]MBC2604179.1 hypothetical protein [Puniceicoccus vermicola]
MSESPLWLNLLLSGPNPDRWKLVRETVSHALPKDEGLTIFVSADELEEAREAFATDRYTVAEWTISDGAMEFSEPLSEEEGNLLIYGRPDFPDDLMDALISGFRAEHFEMGRIVTHVHCGWCEKTEEAKAWFEGCIHFSDLVLLDARHEVEDAWVRDFQEKYRKLRYPCHFDLVRKNLPKHPQWFFDSQPRRLSLVFDPDDLSGLGGEEYEIEGDPPDEEDDPEAAGDPYLRRNAAGERERKVRPLPFALDGSTDSEK